MRLESWRADSLNLAILYPNSDVLHWNARSPPPGGSTSEFCRTGKVETSARAQTRSVTGPIMRPSELKFSPKSSLILEQPTTRQRGQFLLATEMRAEAVFIDEQDGSRRHFGEV